MDLITKLETGGSNLKKSNFNIFQLIENVIEMLEISASKKNIQLVVDRSPNQSLKVYADKEKIEQVLTNLIENSIKYGKESGTTEIVVQEVMENKLIIRVTDNGIGVDNKNLERLFERFYRVDQTGNRSTGGSGLVLAIVKHIIDAHDEKILCIFQFHQLLVTLIFTSRAKTTLASDRFWQIFFHFKFCFHNWTKNHLCDSITIFNYKIIVTQVY